MRIVAPIPERTEMDRIVKKELRGSSHGLADNLGHIWIDLELFRSPLELLEAIWSHLVSFDHLLFAFVTLVNYGHRLPNSHFIGGKNPSKYWGSDVYGPCGSVFSPHVTA